MYLESITEAISDYKADEKNIQNLSDEIEKYIYVIFHAQNFEPEPYETLYISQKIIRKIKDNGSADFELIKNEVLDYIESIRRPAPNNEKVKAAIRELLIDTSKFNEFESQLLAMTINIAFQKAFVKLSELSKQVNSERHMAFDYLRGSEIKPDLWELLAIVGPEKFAEIMVLMQGKEISFPARKRLQDAELGRQLKASKKSDQKISNEELAKLFEIEPHRVKYLLSQKNGLTDLYEDEKVMSEVFNRILKLELYESLQKKKK